MYIRKWQLRQRGWFNCQGSNALPKRPRFESLSSPKLLFDQKKQKKKKKTKKEEEEEEEEENYKYYQSIFEIDNYYINKLY